MPTRFPDPHASELCLRDAAALGYAGYSTLHAHVREGVLPARKHGRTYSVTVDDLRALYGEPSGRAIDAAIDRLVMAAPRFTPAQVERLAAVVGSAR